MKHLSVRQMRLALPRLGQMLEREGEIVLTRRGHAVARLLPIRRNRPMPSHKDLRTKMPKLSTGSEALIRRDRDAR